MWLRTIAIRGFRNLRNPVLEFDPAANYLFGNNAAGKTSLLEAIHYLAIGRSFRPAQDKDVLQFGLPAFSVQGEGVPGQDSTARRAEIRADGQTKRLFLDGIEIDRLSSYLGWLPVVTMLLDDIRLVRGSPAERRGFLDLALSKISRPYLLALAEYRRVLVLRNRVLTQTGDETIARTWEGQLARAGQTVYQIRNSYLPQLLSFASTIAADLFESQLVEFSYRATVKQEGNIQTNFSAALEQNRAREREFGFTLVGPHRDDIIIKKVKSRNAPDTNSDSRDLRRFGSEGEQRSASIALKFAEARLLRDQRQEAPVFLLDEIASELDPERSEHLFALLASQGQIFYAAAKPIPTGRLRGSAPGRGHDSASCPPVSTTPPSGGGPEQSDGGKVFHVQAGEILQKA